jgi:hypothetical protein
MSNETQTMWFRHGAVTWARQYRLTMHSSALNPSPTTARLLIHDGGKPGMPSGNREALITRLRRLGALYLPSHRSRDADGATGKIPLRLQINNIRGYPVFATHNAALLTDLPLPAGTYHITARWGCIKRCYTLALAQGTCFDLYLRPALS